jgi:hypothetical protein
MAYWRTYFKDHKYDPTAEKAEERKFMDDWKTPVVQIRPEECMMVICHAFNTFDKRRLLEQKNPRLKKLAIKMRSIVREQWIRDFYTKDLVRHYAEADAKAAAAGAAPAAPVVSDAEVFGAAEFVSGAPTPSVAIQPAEQVPPVPTEPLPALHVSEMPPV